FEIVDDLLVPRRSFGEELSESVEESTVSPVVVVVAVATAVEVRMMVKRGGLRRDGEIAGNLIKEFFWAKNYLN
ncbi:hypothetical protein AKJ16_DCAP04786, partial [Drosera capensis]